MEDPREKEQHMKTKTEFKRDSLSRVHQYNNILVYYIGYFFEVYAKIYYKTANKIVPFLLVSHIVHDNEEIYRYDSETKILKYKIPGTNEEIKEVNDVNNLDSDIHRRQLNILIVFAKTMGMNIRYSESYLTKSKIKKWNIVMIDFHDHEKKHHIITLDNLDDYYEDVKQELTKQMKSSTRTNRIFLIHNPLFVYPLHSILQTQLLQNQQNQNDENND